eukprot:UN12672
MKDQIKYELELVKQRHDSNEEIRKAKSDGFEIIRDLSPNIETHRSSPHSRSHSGSHPGSHGYNAFELMQEELNHKEELRIKREEEKKKPET